MYHFIAPLFYLGLIGGFAFVLVYGVHGGNVIQKIIGVTLYLLVNTAVYYAILRFFLGRLRPER